MPHTNGIIPNPLPSGLTYPNASFTGTTTLGDGSATTAFLASNLSGASDPAMLFGNSSIDISPVGTTYRLRIDGATTSFGLSTGWVLGWGTTAIPSGTNDTGLSRVSAGLVGVGTGAAASVAGALRAAYYATSVPVTETGTTHTVAITTAHLICSNAAAVTVTLPAAATFPGRELTIRAITANTVVSASSNVVPRIGGAAGTAIIGATDGGWALLVSDGTNWECMAGTP